MEKLRVLKDPESMWSMSNPFQDLELSQQNPGKLSRAMKTLWSPEMEKFLRMSSPERRGRFPAMQAGGTEEGTLHGWEGNVHFNLGVAVEK